MVASERRNTLLTRWHHWPVERDVRLLQRPSSRGCARCIWLEPHVEEWLGCPMGTIRGCGKLQLPCPAAQDSR